MLRFFLSFFVCLFYKVQIIIIVATQHKLTIESKNKTTLYFFFLLKIYFCRRQHDVNILMREKLDNSER